MRPSFLAACIGVFLCAGAAAQTTKNPDISLIGDIRAFSHNDSTRSDEENAFNLDNPQLELFIAGYLNPFARAAATIAWHTGADAEIEEAYAEFVRGLPLGMQLRAGKYLLEFGRLNPTHPHAWSFVKRPLPHELFFGDHGLTDMAVRTSVLLPTGNVYTELGGAVLKGDALMEHDHAEAEDDHEAEHDNERIDPGFLGRLTSSFALSDISELALGVSVLNAVYAEGEHHEPSAQQAEAPDPLRAWVSGFDLKYKRTASRNSALLIEAEGLWRSDENPEGDNLTSYGAYGYLDYRFRQRYNAGGIFEYVRQESIHEDLLGEHVAASTDLWRVGLFVGFAPVEETSLVRLAGHWTEPADADSFWELTLQLVFSLGPHQPHHF